MTPYGEVYPRWLYFVSRSARQVKSFFQMRERTDLRAVRACAPQVCKRAPFWRVVKKGAQLRCGRAVTARNAAAPVKSLGWRGSRSECCASSYSFPFRGMRKSKSRQHAASLKRSQGGERILPAKPFPSFPVVGLRGTERTTFGRQQAAHTSILGAACEPRRAKHRRTDYKRIRPTRRYAPRLAFSLGF